MSHDNERTPLLSFLGITHNDPDPESAPRHNTVDATQDYLSDADLYTQFCRLVGVRPSNLPTGIKQNPQPDSLYHRAMRHHSAQTKIYWFTAALTNLLLLSQIILGAALTGLGASDSPKALIVVFGALNTVIAGVIAFLKSRGQPMRARMFRDDLERVVDEIENSATMWQGIAARAHGYDAIDIDEQVTVRSEVARLMRLYDRAVKSSTLNDPDMYNGGGFGDMHSAALRDAKGNAPLPPGGMGNLPIQTNVMPPVGGSAGVANAPAAGAVVPPIAADPDESPATNATEKKESKKDEKKVEEKKVEKKVEKKDIKKVEKKDEKTDEAKKDKETKGENKATAGPSASKENEEKTTAKPETDAPEGKKGEDQGKVQATSIDPDESPASAAKPPSNGTKE